jgi:hypothetical protein
MGKISLSLGKKNGRSCEGCTACCEGWLTAEIKGEMMYPGKPCQFVEQGVGCTIYKDRPKDPCKEFRCMWRDTDEQIMPDEFKPSEVKSMVTRQQIQGIDYLMLTECGAKPLPEVLSWFVTFAIGNNQNAMWTVDGKAFWIGHPEFNHLMTKEHFEPKLGG